MAGGASSEPSLSGGSHGRAVLVLGEVAGLGAALMRRLEQAGIAADSAMALSDSEISAMLGEDRWQAVVIVSRDDVLSLRLTLLSAHVRPDLPLWVTMFDKTIRRELQHVVSKVHVVAPSELVAGELAEQCVAMAAGDIARGRHGIRLVDDALRLLVYAGAGLVLALLVDVAIGMVALHEGVVNAFYFSTRSVATVAGTPGATSAPTWYKALAVLDLLAALLLVAVFTAALVRRLSQPRLTTLLGPCAAPARHHVLLVGFGQVGFRLAQQLRARGVAVLGVERDPEAPCVRLARAAGIPVAIGRGDDRQTLIRAGIRSCSAVAAVTSADLVNVAVGLAASDLSPGIPLVLRLGDGEVAAETDSLLHLGRICDAHKVAVETLMRGLGDLAPTVPAARD
ncbi:MAG TPA: NAD(P)-binding protein [Solirubrobacteraceae bacterium]|nr:NAD(P)-binding protein [Solirubrobacteraceae bacterium]